MSTEYEAHVIVGAPLSKLWADLSEEFKEEHELEDMWDYREYLWGFEPNLMNDNERSNWIGLPVIKDGELWNPEDMGMLAFDVQAKAMDFKAITGVDGMVTTIVSTY